MPTKRGSSGSPHWHDPRETPIIVRWDWFVRQWRVSGPEGDYGLNSSQTDAIRIAIDAAVTGGAAIGHAFRRIEVYDMMDIKQFVITKVTGRTAAHQFFQDAVS